LFLVAAGPSDMLVVVRLDSQQRGAPVAANNPAVVSETCHPTAMQLHLTWHTPGICSTAVGEGATSFRGLLQGNHQQTRMCAFLLLLLL
jgi:hypothetical protein